MTDQNYQLPGSLAGMGDVDTEGRAPQPEPGSYVARIIDMRFHKGKADDGVRFSYMLPGDKIRGHRASLKVDPRFAVNYGKRDVKRAVAALMGFVDSDPRAKALTDADIAAAIGPAQSCAGKIVRMEVAQGKPNPKKPGEFYMNVSFFPAQPGDEAKAPGESAVKAAISEAAAQETATPPTPPAPASPQAPPAPPAPSGDGGPWFALPASDPRHATHVYNAKGDVKPI